MVGGDILRICLNHPEIDKIYCFVRSKQNIQHPKIYQIIRENYINYKNVENILKEIHCIFFCIGVYTGQESKEKFYKITVDMPVALAETVAKVNPKCNFCLLSGSGADPTEKSRFLFAKTKGIAENKLFNILPHTFYTFRPAYIHPSRKRKAVNYFYGLSEKIYNDLNNLKGKFFRKKIFISFARNTSITSLKLAYAMIEIGIKGYKSQVIEHKEIHVISDSINRIV